MNALRIEIMEHNIKRMSEDLAALKRLESVQGPERHLVGDVAERIPQQDDVEEVEPGRRGVGKIGGAGELLGHVERIQAEVLSGVRAAVRLNDFEMVDLLNRAGAALDKLEDVMIDKVRQRSDLPNV